MTSIFLNSAHLQTLKHDKSKYKSRAQELDRRLSDANKAIKSREELIESLETADKELNQQIEDLRVSENL